jgi:aspartyl-tRNA(Asn)/glutamyl-tRNA(Gln) amidotransferase subunit C
MTVTKDDTKYAANLARLGLTDREIDIFTGQLNCILSYIDVINSADTDDVLPSVATGHPADQQGPRLRDDIEKPFKDISAILDNSPAQESGMFCAPKILAPED